MEDKLDSDEEMYFFWYMKELKEKGFIKSIELQPKAFDLSDSFSPYFRRAADYSHWIVWAYASPLLSPI